MARRTRRPSWTQLPDRDDYEKKEKKADSKRRAARAVPERAMRCQRQSPVQSPVYDVYGRSTSDGHARKEESHDQKSLNRLQCDESRPCARYLLMERRIWTKETERAVLLRQVHAKLVFLLEVKRNLVRGLIGIVPEVAGARQITT